MTDDHRADEYREYDEVTVPRTEPDARARQHDLDDPADVPVDPETLRNGGPTRGPGALTTRERVPLSDRPGGPRGPRPPAGIGKRGMRVAPTTTGDATSGGMTTSTGGSTSDATTGAEDTTGGGRSPRLRPTDAGSDG